MEIVTARPLQLQCFDTLVNLEAVDFPPAPPTPDQHWVDTHDTWGGIRAATPVRLDGWTLHVPGVGPVFVQRKERADALHRYITSHLKAASYLAEYDGNLCDWRPGREGKILRRGYMGICPVIRNGQELKASLRAIPSEPYKASFYFTTSDGACLCPDCVRRELPAVVHAVRYEFEDGWRVIGCDTHWESAPDAELTCDQCSRIIPPVYGEA